MEKYPRDSSEVHEGQQVRIETDDGDLFEGSIAKIITKLHNFLGVKVEIDNGKVGRIKSVLETTLEENYLEKEFRQDQNCQEGQTLEFKASFLFDLKRYDRNGEIEFHRNNPHNIAKTIAAFANSKGGKLYIGIHDKDRTILGLEYDYHILKKYEGKKIEAKDDSGESNLSFESNGEFQTALERTMDKLFFNKYDYSENTSIDIFNVDGRDLCVINIKPSKRPVIICKKEKEFYVRHADQSEPYDDIARFCSYWCEHLCKLQP